MNPFKTFYGKAWLDFAMVINYKLSFVDEETAEAVNTTMLEF